jgi:hypothetical protein
VADERSPAEIQREIERARDELAVSLDQLAERTSPKRLAAQVKNDLLAQASSPKGKRVIAITTAAVVALIVLRRARARRR